MPGTYDEEAHELDDSGDDDLDLEDFADMLILNSDNPRAAGRVRPHRRDTKGGQPGAKKGKGTWFQIGEKKTGDPDGI